MHVAGRFYYERVKEFDRAVRAGEYPNAQSIAKRLEVNPRTIQRDIEFMRTRHGAPLVFDPKRNGYAYADRSFRLSSVQLTHGELIAMVVSESVMRAFKGTPFAEDLARAVQKIKEVLDDPVTFDPSQLSEAYSFRTTAESVTDSEIFSALTEAIDSRGRIEITYWSASRDAESTRAVDPYHLAAIDGIFYLVAYCHHRKKILTFSPPRIRSIRLTETRFEIPSDFDANQYFADSMSVMRGEEGESHLVKLRFTPEGAKYVRERRWHASQTLQPLDGGGILMTLRVSHLREVERFVMSWGNDCEAIEPLALRERVRKHLAAASEFYLNSTSGDCIHANSDVQKDKPRSDTIPKKRRGKHNAGD